jgi:hypothetical protein
MGLCAEAENNLTFLIVDSEVQSLNVVVHKQEIF